jgi:hypothetical protein
LRGEGRPKVKPEGKPRQSHSNPDITAGLGEPRRGITAGKTPKPAQKGPAAGQVSFVPPLPPPPPTPAPAQKGPLAGEPPKPRIPRVPSGQIGAPIRSTKGPKPNMVPPPPEPPPPPPPDPSSTSESGIGSPTSRTPKDDAKPKPRPHDRERHSRHHGDRDWDGTRERDWAYDRDSYQKTHHDRDHKGKRRHHEDELPPAPPRQRDNEKKEQRDSKYSGHGSKWS